jgi:ABC-type branched-subunit amino acid transport system substrate-binding protein
MNPELNGQDINNDGSVSIEEGENPLLNIYGENGITNGKEEQIAQAYYVGPNGQYYMANPPGVYPQDDSAPTYYNGETPNQTPQYPAYYNAQQSQTYNPNIVPPKDGMTRVAMLLPLSGNAQKVGQAFRNAALVAQFNIDFDNFVLQFYDTKGTAEGAQQAAAEAISHGVRLILGPLFSDSVKAVKATAKRYGINVVAFTTDPSAAGDNVFTLGLMLPQQVNRLAKYAYENGYKRFAVIAPDNELGKTVVNALERVTDNLGATVSRVEYYDPKATDYTSVVEKITDYKKRHGALEKAVERLKDKEDETSIAMLEELKQQDTIGAADFDAVLIPEAGIKLRSLVSLLSYYDVPPEKVKYLGTTLWHNPVLRKEKLLLGGWFPAPPTETHNNFVAEYKANFGEAPPEIASLAFDAVSLASVVAGNGDFSRHALMNENGFLGVDGIFRLLENGTSERGLSIMEFTKNGFEEISPAPDAFYHAPSADNYYANMDEQMVAPSSDEDEYLIQQGAYGQVPANRYNYATDPNYSGYSGIKSQTRPTTQQQYYQYNQQPGYYQKQVDPSAQTSPSVRYDSNVRGEKTEEQSKSRYFSY